MAWFQRTLIKAINRYKIKLQIRLISKVILEKEWYWSLN